MSKFTPAQATAGIVVSITGISSTSCGSRCSPRSTSSDEQAPDEQECSVENKPLTATSSPPLVRRAAAGGSVGAGRGWPRF
ncbi:cytochrome c oxidase, subunit III domain protein [Mycobacterium xenopi 4042]|uniref:Cytochrome c oxidase, subunit III domain protein n=1 Tax=Mycobacterium xenopi 4042 TaxID=1299334 RepID=X7ZZ55_MYCXE|nr:cytochrome c oxidase, subunit III domain protein [Mycobacterium xenopi 4042]